jgi:hypothetical protein
LFANGDARPDLLLVRATTLAQSAWLRPVADIWTVNARPDIGMDTHIPKMYRSPPLLENEVSGM